MTFFEIFLLAVPVLLLALTVYFANRCYLKTGSKKRAVSVNIVSFIVVALLMVALCIPTFAASDEAAPTETSQTEVQADTQSAADTAAVNSSKGVGLLAAAGVMGLSAIGGGIAIAAAAPAAIGATSEDPKVFGKALIFVALGEAIALYGVIISILIMGNLG